MTDLGLDLAMTRLSGAADSARVLVVGPSLGTSVEALWGQAARLAGDDEVIGWDLPGHGRSRPANAAFTIDELGAVVRARSEEFAGGRPVAYAGVSLGGAVALQFAVEPGVFSAVACIAAAARIGEPEMWTERAALVRQAGTPVMVPAAAQRWFAPGFLDRDPATGNRLLVSLTDADAESYALACEALATFDVRGELGRTRIPLVVAPGELDLVVPPELARQTTDAAPGATTHLFAGCGHLPPAENPGAAARLLRELHTQEVTR